MSAPDRRGAEIFRAAVIAALPAALLWGAVAAIALAVARG